MDLGLLEFRVATAEQEKITLDQRIQAHKAELKQPPTRPRDKPSTLHDPGQDLVTCKEGLDTGGGTVFPVSVFRASQARERERFSPDSGGKMKKKTSSDFLSTHSPHSFIIKSMKISL